MCLIATISTPDNQAIYLKKGPCKNKDNDVCICISATMFNYLLKRVFYLADTAFFLLCNLLFRPIKCATRMTFYLLLEPLRKIFNSSLKQIRFFQLLKVVCRIIEQVFRVIKKNVCHLLFRATKEYFSIVTVFINHIRILYYK